MHSSDTAVCRDQLIYGSSIMADDNREVAVTDIKIPLMSMVILTVK